MSAAYHLVDGGLLRATPLTVGPWSPDHQHAGPPAALMCRAVEQVAAPYGLTHIARLTVNLLRPAPLGDFGIEVREDQIGRNAGHFSGKLSLGKKDIALFTALAQRESALPLPPRTPGHPPPLALKPPADSAPVAMSVRKAFGYAQLVENRLAGGDYFKGPSTVWFRLARPLVGGEAPSPYQRVAVAADSGNGISAALDFDHYSFVNCDLTINLFRRPVGEWICLDAHTWLGGNSCGLAESALYDEGGLIGRATQSLAVRAR